MMYLNKLNQVSSALLFTIAINGIAYGLTPDDFSDLAPNKDPVDKMYSFSLDDKAMLVEKFPTTSLSPRAHGQFDKKTKRIPPTEQQKKILIHPKLQALIDNKSKRAVEVVVTLEENIDFPLFPSIPKGATRDSSIGQVVLTQRRELMDRIRNQRFSNQEKFVRDFNQGGAQLEIVHSFTLANAFVARIDVEDIDTLAQQTGVLLIRPREKILRKLDDGNADNDMAEVRKPYQLNSDLFFDSPAVPQDIFNWIGVIDSGIYSDHSLFDQQFATDIFAWDCVNGDEFCGDNGTAAWNPDDCDLKDSHGTGVSAIIQGNDSLGFQHRGITHFGLDSYRALSDCGTVDEGFADEDVERALLAAIENDDWVVNLSFGAPISVADGITAEQYLIALAADNAFNAGVVVIAAAGNEGPGDGTINCPACAHKALAIGAYNVETPFSPGNLSSRGPASDGRIKPDMITAECMETAVQSGPNDLGIFCGTSAAAPAASGAAMLLKSALENNVDFIDVNEAGYTYATMHMFARNFGAINNDSGSGPINMTSCGRFWFGKISLSATGESVNIPINLVPPYGTGGMKAAIWWPEDANQSHNDIDLNLISSSGASVAQSENVDSVFERVATPFLALSPGQWILEVNAYEINAGPQEIYWAVKAGGCITDITSISN